MRKLIFTQPGQEMKYVAGCSKSCKPQDRVPSVLQMGDQYATVSPHMQNA